MSVKQCGREVDAREFEEWVLMSELEPWGEGRADLRMGILAATLANVWRGTDTEPYTPGDFMPDFTAQTQEEPMDEDQRILEQQALFEWMTVSTGGIIRDGESM